ncbi:MAG: RNA polymerase-binding ATPase, partial [Bacteroidetes bacterium]|nr:RNA polymerase-binding ATPase [Bacteroidota bacterium]
VLVRWYHEGLNAFEKNLEGGNKLISEFGEQLLEVSLSASSPNHTEELKSLITNTATFQKELRTILADGRDRLLEMNSFRPEVANKLVEQIKKEDRDNSLETYLNYVFEHFGIEIEDLAPRTYLLHPNANNIDAFPTIPEEGISITFDRKRALSREDVSFISWDHPMATETIDMIVSSGTGNASFGILKSSGAPAILLEALFVLETVGGQNLHVDRFFPKKPLRVVIDHTLDEVTDLYPVELLNQHLKPGRIDDLLDNETLVETILPNMIDTATQIAEELAETEIANGLKKMNLTLNHEIGRLQSLQEKNNHIRPEEIQIAREEQAELAGLIEGAWVRLDGVLLVRRS